MGEIGATKERSEDMGMMSEVSELYKRQPFEEEMADLGVEVVKPKARFIPFRSKRTKKGPLAQGLATLNARGLSFPTDLHETVRGKWIRFGILEAGQKKYLSWRVLDTKKADTYVVKLGNEGTLYAGSKQIVQAIVEAGFPFGVYQPEEVKGGYIAHLVRTRKIKRKKGAI